MLQKSTLQWALSEKIAGMHLLGYNDAVSWLNEAKTQMFQPTANFENSKIYLYFVCCLPKDPANV